MWPFKPKFVQLLVRLHPLSGIGNDRKEAIKFVNKFFKKSGNVEQLLLDIETSHQKTGSMFIYAEVTKSVAKKLGKFEDKYGIEVVIDDDGFTQTGVRSLRMQSVRKHFTEKQLPWVYSTF
jgi:hypothetical protein